MQQKWHVLWGGGGVSCDFQPSFRGGSLSFVPNGRGGSCVFSLPHFEMVRRTPCPPCTFWPVPKTFSVVQKVEGYLLGQIILAELRDPKGRQAESHNHIGKRNPGIDFLMVTISSGISRGRVRTTTTTTTTAESRNMEAIFQILGWQRHAALVYRVLLWYWSSMLWSIGTCQNKVSAEQYHVTISRAQVYSSSRPRVFWSWLLTKYWFFIGSRAHVRLTCWKQDRIVRKPVNASQGLKFVRNITFSSMQMFLPAPFWVYIWWL